MQANTAKIRGLMAENGDTQQMLADKLGVTRTTVNNYLMEDYPMSLETLSRIAKIYNVDPFILLKRE